MANRWGKMEKMTGFIFLDSKSTVDGACGHEIKRHLLLGRKAVTSLDSVLKCIFSINPILFNHTYIHLKILAKVVSGLKDNEWFTVFISLFLVVQLLSHAPTLCDCVNCCMPGFPCPSPFTGICSNSCGLSQWCHPTVLSSVITFSSCL